MGCSLSNEGSYYRDISDSCATEKTSRQSLFRKGMHVRKLYFLSFLLSQTSLGLSE